MKTIRFIVSALAAIALGLASVSCEGLLKTDSKIVMFESENTLDQSVDTVYSVLGIIQKMQVIADRTKLIGEVRGDLVKTTDNANLDLVEIANFEVSEENRYNSITDYYAVINNCNYYLAHADTAYIKNGERIFIKEYIAVLGFRAWTYLQAAEIYGKIPFVTEPITSGDMADINKYPVYDIKSIANELIDDLVPYVDEELPNYGELNGHLSKNFFIPVRLILGDLCLWAERYTEAARYYHDHVSSLRRQLTTGVANITWNNTQYRDDQMSDDYSNSFNDKNDNNQMICYIPMEGEVYDGVISELDEIYTSTEDNYYYPQLTYSNSLASLAAAQEFCYHAVTERGAHDTTFLSDEGIEFEDTLLRGDLRLYSVMKFNDRTLDETQIGKENDESQSLVKIIPTRIWLYRLDLVYLRLAEALNRAGLPETAFCTLKYGLCEDNILDFVSEEEQMFAEENNMADLLDFDLEFYPANYTYDPSKFRPAYVNADKGYNTIGLHSRGCGDATANTRYVLPVVDKTSDEYLEFEEKAVALSEDDMEKAYLIQKVEEMILDEMALETCFEGYRFGDLIRISMHRGNAIGQPSDNEFLAGKVAGRDSQSSSLYTKLLNSNNWYF